MTVPVTVKVGVIDTVGGGGAVPVTVAVGVPVTVLVAVALGVGVAVNITTVAVGGTLIVGGKKIICPARKVLDVRQLALRMAEIVVPLLRARESIVSPRRTVYRTQLKGGPQSAMGLDVATISTVSAVCSDTVSLPGTVGVLLASGIAGKGVLVAVAFRFVRAKATGEGKICCCRLSS